MKFVLFVVLISIFSLLSPSPIFASSLSSSSYIYDNIGNIQSINNGIDSTKNLSYSYDDLYRLTGTTGGYSAGYLYDADGNILTKTEDTNLTITYTPTDPVGAHAPKSVNGKLLKYDLNGNLIEDSFSNLKITYDYENRPVEIRKLDSNQLLAKYSYDGEGKRVKKEVYDSTIPSSPLKSTTEYVNQYYEKEVPVGQQMKIRKFYVGVAYRENGTLTYSTNDHLSSTTLLTTNTGAKQGEYRYYPYGQPILPSGALTKNGPPNSWIGQKHDDESGLYFLNARYYSPTYGRFVQADSVVDPTTRGNKYSYVGENPVGRSDPLGTCYYENDPLGLCNTPPITWDDPFFKFLGMVGGKIDEYLYNHSPVVLSYRSMLWQQEMMEKGVDFDHGGPDGGPLMDPYMEQAMLSIAAGSTGNIVNPDSLATGVAGMSLRNGQMIAQVGEEFQTDLGINIARRLPGQTVVTSEAEILAGQMPERAPNLVITGYSARNMGVETELKTEVAFQKAVRGWSANMQYKLGKPPRILMFAQDLPDERIFDATHNLGGNTNMPFFNGPFSRESLVSFDQILEFIYNIGK